MRGFKYQITLYVNLKKNKSDNKIESAKVYFNSFIKIVINENFDNSIDKSFEEILYRFDNWISEGSGWVIELINSQYLNTFIWWYFLWCQVRHLNPVNDHSTRIKKEDLDYSGIDFPVTRKDYNKIEDQNDICINVFSYENKIVFPIYLPEKRFR